MISRFLSKLEIIYAVNAISKLRVKKSKDVKQRNDPLQNMLTEGRVVSPESVEEYTVKEPSEVTELFQVP